MTTELIAASKEILQDPLAGGVGGFPSRINTLSILANALSDAIDTVPPSGDEVDIRDVLCKPAEHMTVKLDVTRRQAAIMRHHLNEMRKHLIGEWQAAELVKDYLTNTLLVCMEGLLTLKEALPIQSSPMKASGGLALIAPMQGTAKTQSRWSFA